MKLFTLLFLTILIFSNCEYQIGTGIHDVTGPAGGVGMMGYADLVQRTSGVYTRLFSRAYIILHKRTGKRVVFVNLDLQTCMQSVKQEVAKILSIKYNNLYTTDNIMLTGQHTHSGPAGYSQYVLYNVTPLGFESRGFWAIVNGIVDSIIQAHERLRDGKIKYSKGKLSEANRNRSPIAYANNPKAERDSYEDGDTDKNIQLIRFDDSNDKGIGSLTWFAVHTVSIKKENTLIASDNKGFASLFLEKHILGDRFKPGNVEFISGFVESASGDMTPNTKGDFCPNGDRCDRNSTCNGNSNICNSAGPGKDDIESNIIIADKQFKKALELFNGRNDIISGDLSYRIKYLPITQMKISSRYTTTGKEEKTCRPALGYSFAAGTTDGPGGFGFEQGNNRTTNPFWNFLTSFISRPTKEQIDCHAPKPIFLDMGGDTPYKWVPHVLPIQMYKIGKLVIVGLPGEFTIMAGRRIEKMLKNTFKTFGSENVEVLINTMTNGYSQYTSTHEEYLVQRYEGASNLYGPHQLAAYMEELDKMAKAIIDNVPTPSNSKPTNQTSSQLSFHTPVVLDTAGQEFGSPRIQPDAQYRRGTTVSVEFQYAHMYNNFEKMEKYITIEKKVNNNWIVVKTDADIDTSCHWERYWRAFVFPDSIFKVQWKISTTEDPGVYRIRNFGYAKTNPVSSTLTAFQGSTREFIVL